MEIYFVFYAKTQKLISIFVIDYYTRKRPTMAVLDYKMVKFELKRRDYALSYHSRVTAKLKWHCNFLSLCISMVRLSPWSFTFVIVHLWSFFMKWTKDEVHFLKAKLKLPYLLANWSSFQQHYRRTSTFYAFNSCWKLGWWGFSFFAMRDFAFVYSLLWKPEETDPCSQ